MEKLAEKYILLDSLLYKLVTTPKKETALLAIPETFADKIIAYYYSSLFAGHQGVIKMHLTIGNKFFIPDLIHYLSIVYKLKTSCKAIVTDNQLKLLAIIKVKHGFKGYA